MPHPTRIADDVFEAARAEAAREGRSITEQVNHWARIGREISIHDSVGRRRIDAALNGALPVDDLSRTEARVLNSEVQATIEESLRNTDLGAELASEGIATVALDQEGRLVEYHPNGTERILSRVPE